MGDEADWYTWQFTIHLRLDRTFDLAKASVPTGALVSFRFDLPNCDVRSGHPAHEPIAAGGGSRAAIRPTRPF